MEGASFQDRKPDCRKVSGIRAAQHEIQPLAIGKRRMLYDAHEVSPFQPSPGAALTRPAAETPGRARTRAMSCSKNATLFSGSLVAGSRASPNASVSTLSTGHADIGGAQPLEALEQQSRADQEHHRESHFHREQNAPQQSRGICRRCGSGILPAIRPVYCRCRS